MDTYSTSKVIGIVEQELSEKHVRIKAIALKSDKGEISKLSEQEASKFFPPYGYVFEPGFFLNFKFQRDEIIAFNVDQNIRAEGTQDKFRIHPERHKSVKPFGVPVRNVNGFVKKNLTVDVTSLSVDGDLSDGEFFGLTEKYIIDKLRLKNGRLEPAHYNRIKVWDRDDAVILEYKKTLRLDRLPQGNHMILDCMDDKQLFEWFRSKLKTINADYVHMLDVQAKWREELPRLFSQFEEEQIEVDKIRLRRVEGKFNAYRFSIDEIKLLADTSDQLKRSFQQSIDFYKEEMKSYFISELAEHENKIKKQDNIITDKNTEIESLQLKAQQLAQNIQVLENSKERILGDFSIIRDVVNSGATDSRIKEESFVIEYVAKEDTTFLFTDLRQLVTRIQFQLQSYGLNASYATRLLEVILLYKASFVKDIRLALAFVNATGHAKYIIRQTEPDWLHFKDFWSNGLGAIWDAAFKCPDQLHFLLLQDLNLSSPECYARPLLDCLNEIRRHIPFGKTTYPSNLRILATKAPTENPKIGLPVIDATFHGWGAIGFKDGIYNVSDQQFDNPSGFITAPAFFNFTDSLDKSEVNERIKNDLKNVFDVYTS